MKNEKTIDQQIHDDVYSAQGILLKEAEIILSELESFDNEKQERLSKLHELGFKNAQAVADFMKVKSIREQQEKNKQKIEYYSQTYPLHKFIDGNAVDMICKKYKLLLADVDDYTAEIPEEKQNEIINFRVFKRDLPYSGMEGLRLDVFVFSLMGRPTVPSPADDDKVSKNTKIPASRLKIIAPKSKLNTKGRRVAGNKLLIKDPIVLQPVENGYLIVTSWGLESSDPIVVNPVNN